LVELVSLSFLPLIKAIPNIMKTISPVFSFFIKFEPIPLNHSFKYFYFVVASFFFAVLCFSKNKNKTDADVLRTRTMQQEYSGRLYITEKGFGIFENLLPFLVSVPVLEIISQFLVLFSIMEKFNQKFGINYMTTLINIITTALITFGWVFFLIKIAVSCKKKLFRVCFFLLVGVQMISYFYLFYYNIYGDLSRAITLGDNHILDSVIYSISGCVHYMVWFIVLFIFMFSRQSTVWLRFASLLLLGVIFIKILQRPVFIPLLNTIQTNYGVTAFTIIKIAYTYVISLLDIVSNVFFFSIILLTKKKTQQQEPQPIPINV
jgi:hypothetical protein